MQPLSLEASLEALLFVSDQPLAFEKIKELFLTTQPELSLESLQTALSSLKERYQRPEFGIQLIEVAHGYQLQTKIDCAPWIQKLAKVQVQRLSAGALETLAIIAYNQPILKDRIDHIRGVDSGHFLRLLMEKNLIEIKGRSELPGKPILYATTIEFLNRFGLTSLKDLPSLAEIQNLIPTSEVTPEQSIRNLIQNFKPPLLEDEEEDSDFDLPPELPQVLSEERS